MWKRSASILWLVGYNLETRIPRGRIGRRIIRAECSSAEPSNNRSLLSTAGKEWRPMEWSSRSCASRASSTAGNALYGTQGQENRFLGFQDGKLYSDNFFALELLGHTVSRTNTMEFTQMCYCPLGYRKATFYRMFVSMLMSLGTRRYQTC